MPASRRPLIARIALVGVGVLAVAGCSVARADSDAGDRVGEVETRPALSVCDGVPGGQSPVSAASGYVDQYVSGPAEGSGPTQVRADSVDLHGVDVLTVLCLAPGESTATGPGGHLAA